MRWVNVTKSILKQHAGNAVVNPLMVTLKLQSNGPLYSNTVIGRVKCAKPKQLTVKLRVAHAYMINASVPYIFLQLVASPARLR